jgi:hypothetical protein
VRFVVGAALVVLAAAAFGYHEHELLAAARAHIVRGELQPIATLLAENQAITHELQSAPYTEVEAGILEAYLIKTRRDGVPKHADMKQRLDQLAENDAAIVTLLKAYAPHARTQAFAAVADKYRNYASAWRDRWNSVMELFMSGGNYAVASVPAPEDFAAAVDAEIVATQ